MGISPSEFDNMTPKQLNIYAGAFAGQQEDSQYRVYLSAVLTSGFMSILLSKKHPKLPTYEETFKKRKEMTDEDMLRVVIALNAAAGGIDKRGEGK